MKCLRLWSVTYSFIQMIHVSHSNMKMWKKLKINWILNFSSLCDWFMDNKYSIRLHKDKTKSILFGTKLNIKQAEPLNIVDANIKIKQYAKVTYLGYILDESQSGELMVLCVLNKINSRLRFLYRQHRFLNKPLQRLLCNRMMQYFFDYACSVWYPSLRNDLQKRPLVSQNNYVRFCLQLDEKTWIGVAKFKEINWFNINDSFLQWVLSSIYGPLSCDIHDIQKNIFEGKPPQNLDFKKLKWKVKLNISNRILKKKKESRE